MQDAYSIHTFDHANGVTPVLAALGVNKRTQWRPHTFALNRYLREQGALTIVVEHCYVDAGYLSDYGNYYARCYASYPRTTRRLHYFARELDEATFTAFVLGTDMELAAALQDSYLGFSVAQAVTGNDLWQDLPACLPRARQGPDEPAPLSGQAPLRPVAVRAAAARGQCRVPGTGPRGGRLFDRRHLVCAARQP
jgi:hypothetical protein